MAGHVALAFTSTPRAWRATCGLPQQNAARLADLTAAVEIELLGPGARLIRLGTGEAASRVGSDTLSFLHWVTHRTTWEAAGVTASGHQGDLTITRSLRVF